MFISMSAANVAYRKMRLQSRKKALESERKLGGYSFWMASIASHLPEDDSADLDINVNYTKRERMEIRNYRVAGDDPIHWYDQVAWIVYDHVTSTVWFESIVLAAILLVGATTGIELEAGEKPSDSVVELVDIVSILTTIIFTCEIILKILAEGTHPFEFFADPDNGAFNTFDFLIVVVGFCLSGSSNDSSIGALRMLRLVRLFTFIKNVPALRVILMGLLSGLKSVTWILTLLFLVIYLFAILGCLFLGENDPGHFGTVPIAMLSLFQVSTLASWTTIAFTSWFGCERYLGGQYDTTAERTSMVTTSRAGNFLNFQCNTDLPRPMFTFIFFSIYIVLTSWVIMTLFIGVISTGMFEAYDKSSEEKKSRRYRERLAANRGMAADIKKAEVLRKAGYFGGGSTTLARATNSEIENEIIEPELKLKIDKALKDDLSFKPPEKEWERKMQAVFDCCRDIAKTAWFSHLVTWTILLVGILTGVETDNYLHCDRRELRIERRKAEDPDWKPVDSWCEHDLLMSGVVSILAQTIFAFECTVKILSQGWDPMRYFTDRDFGRWNCLDFLIVVVGFIEMSPISFIFEKFPVVILRLLRLLRVFRLAKSLPRLRSIVEALMSGFSAVGWVVIFIVIFNYIAACMLMLIFQRSDPFHFGSVSRSMFNVMRMETLDSWDAILRISVRGCDMEPNYDYLPNLECTDPLALGWMAVLLLFSIIIFGGYVLPTVLIGIVAISFDDASRKAKTIIGMLKEMNEVVEKAKEDLPSFITPNRVDLIRDMFDEMDADAEMTLDFNELYVFFHYVFAVIFDIEVNREECEAIFHLMDTDGETDIHYGELVMFTVAVKQIELRCEKDPLWAKKAFPNGIGRRVAEDGSIIGSDKKKKNGGGGTESKLFGHRDDDMFRRKAWVRAVNQLDLETLSEVWARIIQFVERNDSPLARGAARRGEEFVEQHMNEIRKLFADVDGNCDSGLDPKEFSRGISALGCPLSDTQVDSLVAELDVDCSGRISFREFARSIAAERNKANEALEMPSPSSSYSELLDRTGNNNNNNNNNNNVKYFNSNESPSKAPPRIAVSAAPNADSLKSPLSPSRLFSAATTGSNGNPLWGANGGATWESAGASSEGGSFPLSDQSRPRSTEAFAPLLGETDAAPALAADGMKLRDESRPVDDVIAECCGRITRRILAGVATDGDARAKNWNLAKKTKHLAERMRREVIVLQDELIEELIAQKVGNAPLPRPKQPPRLQQQRRGRSSSEARDRRQSQQPPAGRPRAALRPRLDSDIELLYRATTPPPPPRANSRSSKNGRSVGNRAAGGDVRVVAEREHFDSNSSGQHSSEGSSGESSGESNHNRRGGGVVVGVGRDQSPGATRAYGRGRRRSRSLTGGHTEEPYLDYGGPRLRDASRTIGGGGRVVIQEASREQGSLQEGHTGSSGGGDYRMETPSGAGHDHSGPSGRNLAYGKDRRSMKLGSMSLQWPPETY